MSKLLLNLCKTIGIVQILPACQTWYDYVWAYFKTLVDVQVEKVSWFGERESACTLICVSAGYTQKSNTNECRINGSAT